MQVIGSGQEARGLATGIRVRARSIVDLTKDINGKLNTLRGSYQDSGFAELEETVNKVVNSILSHSEDVNTVIAGLNEYAEVLDRTN